MKTIVVIGLFAVGAFAIWKHHLAAATAAKNVSPNSLPAGVSQYPANPAPQQAQQVQASLVTNSDAVSDLGYGAAFGPYENQPGDGEELY